MTGSSNLENRYGDENTYEKKPKPSEKGKWSWKKPLKIGTGNMHGVKRKRSVTEWPSNTIEHASVELVG